MKKLLCMFLVLGILLTAINMSVSGAVEIKVYYDGSKIVFDVDPIIKDGRTMVPKRAIFEPFGADMFTIH